MSDNILKFTVAFPFKYGKAKKTDFIKLISKNRFLCEWIRTDEPRRVYFDFDKPLGKQKLVLEGSFCDEYGEYSKGDIQINDQKIKHTPIASKDTGCVCLSITEKDVIFFGKYGSFLNLFTFIKSFFKQK